MIQYGTDPGLLPMDDDDPNPAPGLTAIIMSILKKLRTR